MAQYFYDLSIGQPGELPYWLDRGGNSKPSTHRWTTSRDGFSVIADAAFTVARLKDPAVQGVSNVEVLIKSSLSVTAGVVSYGNTAAGVVVRAEIVNYANSTARNGYLVTLNGSLDLGVSERHVNVFSMNNGSFGTAIAAHSDALAANASRSRYLQSTFLRLRANGTTISYKAWRSTDEEPAVWLGSLTHSAHSSGDVVLYLGGNGISMTHAFVSVGTDGDSAPSSFPGGPRVVAGVVRDPLGVAVGEGYIVRCYHRASGAILGETLTNLSGAYSFEVNLMQSEEIYCLAIDNLGNSWGIPTVDRPVS